MTVQELLEQAISRVNAVIDMPAKQAAQQFEIGAIQGIADAVLKLAQADSILRSVPQPPAPRLRAVGE